LKPDLTSRASKHLTANSVVEGSKDKSGKRDKKPEFVKVK